MQLAIGRHQKMRFKRTKTQDFDANHPHSRLMIFLCDGRSATCTHKHTHTPSEDPGWAHKHDVMMMITTHNRPGVFHSTYRGMQGNCWQIMTAPLRWHDNQVLLHLVRAARYQSMLDDSITIIIAIYSHEQICFHVMRMFYNHIKARIPLYSRSRAICNKKGTPRRFPPVVLPNGLLSHLWGLSGLSHFIPQSRSLRRRCAWPLHLRWHRIWFNLPITAPGTATSTPVATGGEN